MGLMRPLVILIGANIKVYDVLPRFFARMLPGAVWPFHYEKFSHILQLENFVTSNISHFAVLVTFGVLVPPLAIVIAISALSEYATQQFIMWRFVKEHSLDGSESSLRAIAGLDTECVDAWRTPKHSIWALLGTSSIFLAFVAFDMAYDDVSADPTKKGYIALPILTFLFPLVLFLCKKLNQYYKQTFLATEMSGGGLTERVFELAGMRFHIKTHYPFRFHDDDMRVTGIVEREMGSEPELGRGKPAAVRNPLISSSSSSLPTPSPPPRRRGSTAAS